MLNYLFENIPLFLGSILSVVTAIYVVASPTGWTRTKLIWLIFFLAMIGALARGEVQDILFSNEWTLPFLATVTIFLFILPIWEFKISISASAIGIVAALFFLFLGTEILLSNVIGVTLYIGLWVVLLRTSYTVLKHWVSTPAGKDV